MTSYQEQMLRLALQRHFETEKENFCNRKYKIKTLALFFIDDIASYRGSKDGEPSYLLDTFERLLKEEITKISDCDSVRMVESFKQDTKEFDNLLKLDHYTEEDSDKVLEMISNFSEIACKHLSEKIDKLVDLHETFNDFTR